jgi:crotonobetainyl-CoA:carnitine CoA-transferase CaiB-like acyl-CoA transferase
MQHADELDAIIEGWVAEQDLETGVALLSRAGIPAGPVYSIADIVRDPHLTARGAVTTGPGEDGGDVAAFGIDERELAPTIT